METTGELCDVVSFLAFCHVDSTVLIIQHSFNDLWIPSAKITTGNSWSSVLSKDIKEVCVM